MRFAFSNVILHGNAFFSVVHVDGTVSIHRIPPGNFFLVAGWIAFRNGTYIDSFHGRERKKEIKKSPLLLVRGAKFNVSTPATSSGY